MDDNKNGKVDKPSFWLGLLSVACGIVMIFQGYGAYRSGEIIPLTGKHGPMTGPEYMIGGAMFSLLGLGFVLNELVNARRKQK